MVGDLPNGALDVEMKSPKNLEAAHEEKAHQVRIRRRDTWHAKYDSEAAGDGSNSG